MPDFLDARVPPGLREAVARDLRPVRPLARPAVRALWLAPLAILLLVASVVAVYGISGVSCNNRVTTGPGRSAAPPYGRPAATEMLALSDPAFPSSAFPSSAVPPYVSVLIEGVPHVKQKPDFCKPACPPIARGLLQDRVSVQSSGAAFSLEHKGAPRTDGHIGV